MPRRVFDDRLVAAAVTAGAELRRHRVRRVEVGDDRVVLDGVLAARVVVGADGASSVVRRALGVAVNPGRLDPPTLLRIARGAVRSRFR